MNRAELFDRLLCLFFPPRCVLCGEVVEYGALWCGRCKFSRRGPVQCGLTDSLSAALCAADYESGARKAVLRLKERDDRRTARFFAGEMCAALRAHWPDIPFDCAVPVPCSAGRLSTAGFNHAKSLADAVGEILGLPVLPNVLVRRDSSLPQHMLSREKRAENARKSYVAGGAGAVKGLRVLLVDDIFTTGFTLAACADLLAAEGAASVHALTAVYTPPGKA